MHRYTDESKINIIGNQHLLADVVDNVTDKCSVHAHSCSIHGARSVAQQCGEQ